MILFARAVVNYTITFEHVLRIIEAVQNLNFAKYTIRESKTKKEKNALGTNLSRLK